MDSARKVVRVEIRADNWLISEGDTASRIMDEWDRGRSGEISRGARLDTRYDHDSTLGNLIGVNYLYGDHDPLNDQHNKRWQRLGFGGWAEPRLNFYHVALVSDATEWSAANPQSIHTGFIMGLWVDRLPIAGNVMLTKGARLGGGFEFQRGRTDVRVHLAYRFTETNVNGSAGSVSHQGEHAGEAGAHTEWLTNGGFVRLGTWGDFGKSGQAEGPYARGGAFARYYTDMRLSLHQSILTDISGSIGGSLGDVPVYRQFAGGNRYDQPLADRFHPVDEYTWAGPLYRAAGVSSFAGPSVTMQPTVPGGHFVGASFTLGLPLYSKPLVQAVDPGQKQQVQELIQNEFNLTVARIMDRGLQAGLATNLAERRSRKEGSELAATLRNLIRHARSLTLRPVGVADFASVYGAGTASRTGFAWGGGMRAQGLNRGVELLYMKSAYDSLRLGQSRDNIIVRLYFRPAVGQQP
jgi:hypothetical protein